MWIIDCVRMYGVGHVGMVVLTSAGVGKTSLVHLICHKEVFSSPSWTVGCSVEVKASWFTCSINSAVKVVSECIHPCLRLPSPVARIWQDPFLSLFYLLPGVLGRRRLTISQQWKGRVLPTGQW